MTKAKNDIVRDKNEEDLKAVRRILDCGDKSAFAFLQNKYEKIIAALIRKMIKDEDDVADLTQETFIKAYNALTSYRSEYAFSSWIYRIASNGCIDFLRKKRFPTISIDKPIESAEDDFYIDIEDTDLTPDMNLISSEKKQVLLCAIEALPENYKRIIKMRHFDDLEYNEIAEKLSLPLGTVKAHLFRARKILLIDLKKHTQLFNE